MTIADLAREALPFAKRCMLLTSSFLEFLFRSSCNICG